MPWYRQLTTPLSAGGLVEGYYEPGGKITVQTYSTHPWSVRHLLDLWYHHAPQMEITGLEQTEHDGSTTKLAADDKHVGNYLKAMLQGSPAGLAVHKALKVKHPDAKLYGVGGAPRDALMGKTPNDLDLLAAGVPQPELEHLLKSLPGNVNFEGKNFGVFHYHHPSGDHVEVAMPRSDKYEGGQRSKADVTVDPDMPIDEDLKRRDFTANSTAVDLDTGHFHDPLGGADDIKRNILRSSHPGSFAEDPTRLVRALTMHGRYGLVPDEQTRHEMEANGHLLRGESPDALRETVFKLFKSNNPAAAIRLGHETGLLGHLLPEFDENWDHDQNNPHHSHVLGEHSLQVLDNMSRLTDDPYARMLALLHDNGKKESEWMDPDTGFSHYYRGPNGEGANHEDVGAQKNTDMLKKRLNLQRSAINWIAHGTKNHMFAPFTTGKGARRFMHRVGEDHVDQLLNLREADQTGKGQTPEEVAAHTSAQQMRDLVENERLNAPTTGINAISVNGNDLINMGVKQGPEVGKALTHLQNLVIDDPSQNDRATLLQHAQQYAQATPGFSPQPDAPSLPLS